MSDDVRWMTYAEIAEALGIGPDSARNLVRRKGWMRQPGNDGTARIAVPEEHIARRDVPPIVSPTEGENEGGIDSTIAQILSRHVDRLEREVERLKTELDIERVRGVQADALQAVLEVERRRISAVEADRDRWHVEAQQVRAIHHADVARAQAEAEAARADLVAWKARPWWHRAFG